jgi:hypothetical protein
VLCKIGTVEKRKRVEVVACVSWVDAVVMVYEFRPDHRVVVMWIDYGV